MSTDHRYALLVAVSHYDKLPPLYNTLHDALDMRDVLLNSYGFSAENIQLVWDYPTISTEEELAKTGLALQGYSDEQRRALIDASATNGEDIGLAVEDFLTQRVDDDELRLLYYGGHGLESSAGQFYLSLRRSQKGKSAIGIEGRALKGWMESGCERQVVILDCCNAAAMVGDSRGVGNPVDFLGDAMQNDELPAVLKADGKGRFLLAASAKYQEALENIPHKSDRRNSVFTHWLLEGLRKYTADGDGLVTPESLHNYVYDRVRNDTSQRQEPLLQTLGGKGASLVLGKQPRLPAELKALIDSDEWDSRCQAVLILKGVLRDDRLCDYTEIARAALVALLNDFDSRVRDEARDAITLVGLDGPRYFEKLGTSTNDGDVGAQQGGGDTGDQKSGLGPTSVNKDLPDGPHVDEPPSKLRAMAIAVILLGIGVVAYGNKAAIQAWLDPETGQLEEAIDQRQWPLAERICTLNAQLAEHTLCTKGLPTAKQEAVAADWSIEIAQTIEDTDDVPTLNKLQAQVLINESNASDEQLALIAEALGIRRENLELQRKNKALDDVTSIARRLAASPGLRETETLQARLSTLASEWSTLSGVDVLRKQAAARLRTIAEQERQAEIDRLLREGKQRIALSKFTKPTGNSAADSYRAVLKLQVGYPDALDGLQHIKEYYYKRFESALEKQDWTAADIQLAGLTRLDPQSEDLSQWQRELATAKERAVAEKPVPNSGVEIDTQRIRAGSFMMGSMITEAGYQSGESPKHRVDVEAFRLGTYAVSNAEYVAFLNDVPYDAPDAQPWIRTQSDSENCRVGQQGELYSVASDDRKRPVVCVSWYGAQAYIDWLNRRNLTDSFRLPSEAEWEYAARAGSTTTYWWGDDIGKAQANCNGCGSDWDKRETAPVDSFKVNDFGLYNTLGNTYEWTQDCRHFKYNGAPNDGSAWTNKCEGEYHVVRGGSWDLHPLFLRSASRASYKPFTRSYSVGFRVAQDL